MSTNVKPSVEEKFKKLEYLREYHKATLDKIDYDVLYRPRRFFKSKETGVESFILFPSELKLAKDVYTEKIDSDNNSEDSTRTLYKWAYTADWAEQYHQVKKGTTTYYLIPTSELTKVPHEMPGIDETVLELSNPDIDAPMDQMTIRDYYAIHHQKPVSQKKWLNEIITKYK